MTQEELIKNILEIPAENQTIEFKRLGGDGIVGKIIETIVAMTNIDGGVVVLGVSDPAGYVRGTKYRLPGTVELKK